MTRFHMKKNPDSGVHHQGFFASDRLRLFQFDALLYLNTLFSKA